METAKVTVEKNDYTTQFTDAGTKNKNKTNKACFLSEKRSVYSRVVGLSENFRIFQTSF